MKKVNKLTLTFLVSLLAAPLFPGQLALAGEEEQRASPVD